MSDFKSRASWALGRGFRVIPVEPGGKKPLISDWPQRASSSEEVIDGWAEKYPDANVGLVATKKEGGTITLDFDNQKFLMEFFDVFPNTAVVKTGSGKGWQVHFLHTAESISRLENKALKNKDEARWGKSETLIEVKTDSAYGIGPGSVHPSGGSYGVVRDLPLSPIPHDLVECLLHLFDPAGDGRAASPLTRPALDSWEDILKVAGLKYEKANQGGLIYLNHHVSMGKCLVKGALHEGSGNPTNNRCSSFVYNPNNGELWYQCLAGACEATPGKLGIALKALGLGLKQVLDFRPSIKDARELFPGMAVLLAAPDPKFLVTGLLPADITSAVAGLPGHFKTWVALSLAKSLATGAPWLGHFEIRSAAPSLYLLPEAGMSHLKSRVLGLGMERLTDEQFRYRTFSQGPMPDLGDKYLMRMAEGRVVWLDTATCFTEGEENSASDNRALRGKLTNLLTPVSEAGAGALAVVLLHHSPKSFRKDTDMNPENSMRGTGDLAALCGMCLALKVLGKPDFKAVVHCEVTKPRDFEPPGPFQLGAAGIVPRKDFDLLKKPGECGFLAEETGEKAEESKQSKKREVLMAHAAGESMNSIETRLHITKRTQKKWLDEPPEEEGGF